MRQCDQGKSEEAGCNNAIGSNHRGEVGAEADAEQPKGE